MSEAPVVLVTGASTGIGAATALRLDRLGYLVFAGVRRPEDGDRLRAQGSERLHPVILDVTRQPDIDAAVRTIDAACGPRGMAGLVNNAGVATGGPIEFVPVDQVRRQFEVNVFGLLAVTQACLPLIRRATGRIVNIGSIAGRTVAPFVVPYGMSKHAVEALSDGLRLELEEAGIKVAVIEPGAVKTPIWEKGLEALGDVAKVLPPVALERYGGRLRFFAKLLAANNDRGVSPERVVDAVVHALEADQPKTRYLVGADARIRAAIAKVLPDRVGDAIVLGALRRMERRLS
jgi:NAD(P)-dependent dehydrogenase (short-subunit alcohol dehydrogenase family)